MYTNLLTIMVKKTKRYKSGIECVNLLIWVVIQVNNVPEPIISLDVRNKCRTTKKSNSVKSS